MKCPKCKKNIKRVRVYSETWQTGYLERNKIVDYGSVEELTETTGIECVECNEDIAEHIEQ